MQPFEPGEVFVDIAYVANWFTGEVVFLDLVTAQLMAPVIIAPKRIAGLAQSRKS